MSLRVIDEQGNPIEGALVQFASYKIALKPSSNIRTGKTDSLGQFYLERAAYTQMVILAADGGHSYDWSYCIEKPGYQAIARNALAVSYFSNRAITETMVFSEAPATCKWQEFFHGFTLSSSRP